jgi:hypothetical protein
MELCNFLRFKQRDGSYTAWSAQNFFPGEEKSLGEVAYRFVPIAVATNASTRNGDRSEAAISTVASQITLNVFYEATQKDWLLEIKTAKINRSDFSIEAILTTEIWACSQLQYDTSEEGVVLQLSSPLDSVSRLGGRFLSQGLVGSLPTSGTLSLQ